MFLYIAMLVMVGVNGGINSAKIVWHHLIK